MKSMDQQLAEDRALRDAALRLVKADVGFIRQDLAERGPGGRIVDRVSDATIDTVDDAVDYAQEHRVMVIGAAIAIVAWFAREPLSRGLTRAWHEVEDRLD